MKNLKKLPVLCLSMLTVWGLTTTAYADVVFDPADLVRDTAGVWLPPVLVVLAIVVTVVLLLKYRKRK